MIINLFYNTKNLYSTAFFAAKNHYITAFMYKNYYIVLQPKVGR